MNSLKDIDIEKFKKAVENNISISKVIVNLGISISGSSYTFVKNKIKELQLNTSHWLGKSHGKNGQKARVSWNKVLIENSPYHLNANRRKRLVIEKFLTYKCEICNCDPYWNEKPLSLRLDHKNGKNRDHRIENLRFVCPNCDSQLPTFCSRNKVYQKSFNVLLAQRQSVDL